MEILRILPLIFWLILWTYWFISALHSKKSVPKENSWWMRMFITRFALLAIVILLLDSRYGEFLGNAVSNFLHPASTVASFWISVFGVILCATGISFAIWARVYLGKNWGMPMTLREKPELVTSGPYKLVRHPIYSGFLLAILGTSLVDGAVWLIFLVCAGIYFIYSAKTEQKNMLQLFPNEYPAYMKRTKMLIPFIL